jgi:hypothetical protein
VQTLPNIPYGARLLKKLTAMSSPRASVSSSGIRTRRTRSFPNTGKLRLRGHHRRRHVKPRSGPGEPNAPSRSSRNTARNAPAIRSREPQGSTDIYAHLLALPGTILRWTSAKVRPSNSARSRVVCPAPARRAATSPAVCRESTNCSRHASRRKTRSSPTSKGRFEVRGTSKGCASAPSSPRAAARRRASVLDPA